MTDINRDHGKEGASVRSMRTIVLGMLCLLALALAAVVGLKLMEGRHIKTLIGYSEDNASWAVHALQAEQLRLENALRAAGEGAPAPIAEAALRYETFASRRSVLLTGVFHRNLKSLPAYQQVMTELERFLAVHDPLMADGLQPAEVPQLLAAVSAMRAPVNDLATAENALLSEIQSESRMHIANLRAISIVTLSVLIALILGFGCYALVVLSRAQAAERALGQSECDLRAALKQAESASAAKSAFLANMSHDLRTPLNAVIGFAEFLELSAGPQLNERQRGYLGDIRAAGRHLLEILGSILELSKLEAGKIELQMERVPVATLMTDCLRMLAPVSTGRRIATELRDLDTLPPIAGDPTRLRQIFVNLLSNAMKYSAEGRKVLVTGAVEGAFIAIAIVDQGVGMSADDIEIALRPFERIRSADTADQEGVGLGLTIVNTLVDKHRGRLDIKSQRGHGTTVTVRLPAAAVRGDVPAEGGRVHTLAKTG